MKQMKKGLVIKSSSWNKDLNDLIDYDSYDLNNDSMTIHGPGQLRIINNILDFNPYQQDEIIPHIFNQPSSLIDIGNKNGSYYLNKLTKDLSLQEEMDKTAHCPWLMFKGILFPDKHKKYNLLPGDVLKIGRLKLQIKEIHFEQLDREQQSDKNENELEQEEQEESNQTNNSILHDLEPKIVKSSSKKRPKIKLSYNKLISPQRNLKVNVTTEKQQIKRICRICYCDDDSSSNPLIRPCSCAGTMKYIHYACLKHWIETKICVKTHSNQFCVVYLIKNIECELCKATFPDYVRFNGKLYELLGFKPEGKNYVILQSLVKDKNNHKFLYYINYDHTNTISIGRQQDVEVVLSDISVSRYHCLIKKVGKKIFLEDNESKFGTGVLLQNPSLLVLEGDPLYVQISHSLLQFSIKHPFTFFSCCSEPVELGVMTYQRLNSKYLKMFSNDVIKDDKEDTIDENERKRMSPQQRKHVFLNMLEYKNDDNSDNKIKRKNKKEGSNSDCKIIEMIKIGRPSKINVPNIYQTNNLNIDPLTSMVNPYNASNSNIPMTDNIFSTVNNNSNDDNNKEDNNDDQYQADQINNSNFDDQQYNVQIGQNDQDIEQEVEQDIEQEVEQDIEQEVEQDIEQEVEQEVEQEPEQDLEQGEQNNNDYCEDNNEEEEDNVNYSQIREYNNDQLFNVYNYNN